MIVGEHSALSGLRALVVDDEFDSLTLVSYILETWGVEVTAVASAKAAIQSFEANPPDLLICDIVMPYVDGFSLIRQLRALERKESERVLAIALSAVACEDNLRLASPEQVSAAPEFYAYLMKPVEPEKLAETIVTALSP